MKHLLIISCAFLISICAFGQEDEPTDSEKRIEKFSVAKRNEISIDVMSAIAIPALSPRYEYILGRYSGIGVDLFVNLDGDDYGYTDYEKYSLTPYYRQYFFSKEDYGARGFYAEGFLKFFIFEEWFYESINDSFTTNESSFFDTSIGAGIGWKWISQSGFLIDLGVGLGRNLGLPSDDFVGWEVQPRGGLNFGWRF